MGVFYYELLVNDPSYKGRDALTYESKYNLAIGSVVVAPVKNKQVLAIVFKKVSRPIFTTKLLEPTDIPKFPTTTIGFIDWLMHYYPAPISNIVQQFLPSQLLGKNISDLDYEIKEGRNTGKVALPPLSTEQKLVLRKIQKPGTYLLHGDTGTGKTRVYLELAKKVISRGRSAVILTPEISLTTQLYQTFQEVFGNKVMVVHSQIKQKERRLIWLRALHSDIPIVIIGARSAMFTPLKKVGLIVVDEAHETSYKQDKAPHYQTVLAAAKLASLNKSILVLGSATPQITDYFIAEQKNIPILRMENLARATTSSQKIFEIIDIKNRSNFTRNPYISDALLNSIETALSKNEQSLVFLNRRGTARVILCSNCGWQSLCPNCDIPFIYHGDKHIMLCHICGRKDKVPTSCPICSYTDIIFRGTGTKAIFEDLKSTFPKAKIQRFDTDNNRSERFEQHYTAIHQGEVDILVGTQSIAKGLDLPRLSVVGMVAADAGLSMPDFNAQERLYQVVSQVVGRIGRGHRPGKAIIQTYYPNSLILKSALDNDWQSFYNNELAERAQFMYPPFCYLLKLTCKRASKDSAQATARQFTETLRNLKYKIDISGPAPSFHEKQGKKYAWQIVIKSKTRNELIRVLDSLPSGWAYDIDPIDLL